jgi:hypothetical protein
LRAVARHNLDLFKRIIELSRSRYDHDRATYHVSATLDSAPPPDQADAVELEKKYLERWQDVTGTRGFTKEGRQILHTTFGSVLTHQSLKGELLGVLKAHPETFKAILEEHFARHLQALRSGM